MIQSFLDVSFSISIEVKQICAFSTPAGGPASIVTTILSWTTHSKIVVVLMFYFYYKTRMFRRNFKESSINVVTQLGERADL